MDEPIVGPIHPNVANNHQSGDHWYGGECNQPWCDRDLSMYERRNFWGMCFYCFYGESEEDYE